jgi:hypothetical protein
MAVRRKTVAVVTAFLVVLLFTGLQAANAAGNGLLGPVLGPVDTIVDQVTAPVTDVVDTVTGGGTKATAPVAAAPSDDDLAGHESGAPSAPDHASGGIADVDLADGALADGSTTNAQIDDSNHATGDATVLALLGSEIIGAHSDSAGTTDEEFDILGPLCDATGGALCVQLLWASTSSHNDGTTTSSESHTALVFVCLGGTATNADQPCDGPVGAGVGESHSGIVRDNATGDTTAAHESDAADVCLGGEDETSGLCSGLGVNALLSRSGSSSNPAATTRSSQLLGVEALGENNPIVTDPTGLTILPDCPPGMGVACLYLNQGASALGLGSAGSRQEGLHLGVLDELVLAHVSTAETFVAGGAAGPTCNNGQPIPADGVCPGSLDKPPLQQVPGAGPGPRGLSDTGLNMLVPLALALNLMVFGSLVIIWERRGRAAVRA